MTTGLGTFGGWTRTIVNSASLTMTERQDYFGRTIDQIDYGAHNYDFTFDKAGRLTARTNSANESIGYTYYGTGLVSGQTGTQGTAGYEYDSAGNRTKETFSKSGVSYRNATAAWDAMGRMTSWSDTGMGGAIPASTVWEYDKAGNVRHVESSYRALDAQGNASGSNTTQSEWYLYDAMNRFTLTKGELSGSRGSGTIGRDADAIQLTYYLDGNRRSALYEASLLGTHWEYLDAGGQQIFPNGSGTDGTWTLMTFPMMGDRREDYFYTADGYLAATNRADAYTDPGPQPGQYDWEAPEVIFHGPPATGSALSTSTLDAMGRTIYYKEYGGFDGSFERTNIVYDNAGRLQSETSVTIRRDTVGQAWQTYTTNISNTYTSGMLSQQVNDTWKNGSDSAINDSRQTYSYVWWDGALQDVIGNDNDNGGAIDWTTDYSYDGSGHVISADIDDGRDRIVSFVTDQNGMIVNRDEVDNLSGGDPRNLHYFFGGIQFGQVGNDGTDNMSYVAAIKDRLTPVPTSQQGGAFRKDSTVSTPFADFAQSYDAINGYRRQDTGSSYTVQGGETLAMIAQNVWGDSLLWYLIAGANGLSGGEQLVAGQVLKIPNRVQNSRNSADTWRVYDPNEAIGDTSPVDAKPAKKPKCGMIGTILLVAIAVAVTVVTSGAAVALSSGISLGSGIGSILGLAGAASVSTGTLIAAGAVGGAVGSIVSQGVGVATGLQNKFSWKGVAMSALSGAISSGIGASQVFRGIGSFGRGALSAATSSTLSQGIGVATGLQKKFDWVGIAAAAIGGGVSAKLGRNLPSLAKNASITNIASHLGASMAGAFSNAAVRTALTNTGFGDNLMAALPDVIGSTLGNLVAGGLADRETGYDGDGFRGRFEQAGSFQHAAASSGYVAQGYTAEPQAYPGASAYAGDGTMEGWENRVPIPPQLAHNDQSTAARDPITEGDVLETDIVVTGSRSQSKSNQGERGQRGADFVNPYNTFRGGKTDPTQTPFTWLSNWSSDVYLNQNFTPVQARDAINALAKDGRWSPEQFKAFGDKLLEEGSNNPDGLVKARAMLDLAATDPAFSNGWRSVSGRIDSHLAALNARADAVALEVSRSVLQPLDIALSVNSIVHSEGTTSDYVNVGTSGLPGISKILGRYAAGTGRAGRVLQHAPISKYLVGGEAYASFRALKRALGPAGKGNEWHHIVEQTAVGRFGTAAIQNTKNIVNLPETVHRRINGLYNSKLVRGGPTIRQWLSTKSFDFQYKFGLRAIERFSK